MLQITKQGNTIVVKGLDHSLYPYSGTLEIPCNSVITVVDEGDIVTFRSASNYDVLFSGLVTEITINGESVTKENVGDKFGAISNTASGGGGGLTPEQEEKLNNAVQIADYNADKEAQATIDESQNAAIEGLSGDIEGKQDKIDDLDAIREGAEKGATALQEETDPVWNAEKGNYYTKGETDGLVNEAKTAASSAMSVAASAEGIASAAHSMADEALEELKNKADKGDIPSLDGYATEEYVNGEVAKKQDVIADLDSIRANAEKGANTSNVFTEGKAPEGNVGIGIVTGSSDVVVGEALNNGDLFYMRPLGVGESAQIGSVMSRVNVIYQPHATEVNNYTLTVNDEWTVYNAIMEEVSSVRVGEALYARYNGEPTTIFIANVFKRAIGKEGVYVYDGTETPSKVVGEKDLNEALEGKQDKIEDLDTIRDGAAKGATAIQEHQSLDGYATEEWVEGKGYLTEHQDISGKLDKSEAEETYQKKGEYVDVETYNKHITDQSAIDEAQNTAIEGIEGDIARIDSKIDDIELFKFPNATIIGEPTIQSGQVSNFSSENYLQFPFVLDLRNQSFQIDFCFTTSDDVSGQQNVLDSKFGIALAVKDGKGLMAISSNGTSWNIGSVIGTMNIEPNTTYYARLTWDGIQYKTFVSTDGTSYSQDMVLDGTERPFPTTIFIGGCDLSETGHTAHPFKGAINMNKAQLTVMGNVVWQGMDDAGLATRLATNLNNIDEQGEKRIKEIVGTIPTKTSELTNDSGFLTEHQSLEGYATEQWVENKGYLTEHQDISGKLNVGLNNLTEEGKDNLAKLINGGSTQIDNGHVITAEEAAMKWTIDFDNWLIVRVANGDDTYGVIFMVDGTKLNVYGEGGNNSLIRLYRKDTDKQVTIYDEEGYAPVALDNYYLKITEGYTLTYADGEGKLVGQGTPMFTENDPVFKASPAATITSEDIAKWNEGGDNDVYSMGLRYGTNNLYYLTLYKNGVVEPITDKNDFEVHECGYGSLDYTLSTTLSGNELRFTMSDSNVVNYPEVYVIMNGVGRFNFFMKRSIMQKQDKLTSGTTIKTVNGESVLGAGNIVISTPTDAEKAKWNVAADIVKDGEAPKDNYGIAVITNGGGEVELQVGDTIKNGDMLHYNVQGWSRYSNRGKVGNGSEFVSFIYSDGLSVYEFKCGNIANWRVFEFGDDSETMRDITPSDSDAQIEGVVNWGQFYFKYVGSSPMVLTEASYMTKEDKGEKHVMLYDGTDTPSQIATNEWVEGKGYLTEHQDISGKQDVITDLGDIREGAALGKTALQSFTETDPTVPAHVKAITEADIAKWNQGGGGDETDPIWTAEKVNYYTKTEIDALIGDINNALAKLING